MKKKVLAAIILSVLSYAGISPVYAEKTNLLSDHIYKLDLGSATEGYTAIGINDVKGVATVEEAEGETGAKKTILSGQYSFAKKLENGDYRVTAFVSTKDKLSFKVENQAFNDEYLSSDTELSKIVTITDGEMNFDINGAVSVIEISKVLKFDLGSKYTDGFIHADASTKYSEKTGYGFNTPSNVLNVTSSGENEKSDAVEFVTFGTTSDNTFNVDLPNGRYNIKVTAGDISRMSVAAEGYFAIMNMTGNNAVSEIEIPVTDGQLNILATEGKTGTKFSIASLEISKIADDAYPVKTIFIGGDSTTTTYYPLNATLVPTTQGGWGQMLGAYVSKKYYVHNYATGGQFAKGFLTSGQFDAVEHYIKPGDIFIVQFGINDSNYSNEEEYKTSMLEMVKRIKAKGATPILLVAQGRATDFGETNIYYKPDRWYKQTTIAIANQENVPLIDLHNLSSAYFTQIGKDATTALYWINYQGKQDTLHPNRQGAGQLARLVAEDLVTKGIIDKHDVRLYPYGFSDNLTIKVYDGYSVSQANDGTDKCVAYVQNLVCAPKKVTAIVAVYDATTKTLVKTISKTVELAAFDPTKPLASDEISVPLENMKNVTAKMYIYEGSSLIKSQGSSEEYHYYDNAHRVSDKLFANYKASSPAA
ncbi:MAG: GDSL-type esterase/lipase family protein [Clostridia bacterium]|nr:GDSL-type esterase/lipase family protein [Clostridia bacterium]